MNCPSCNTYLCDAWTRCGMCGQLRSKSCNPLDELAPLQRAFNFLTYQMEVIAHCLDHGNSAESVSSFALESRSHAMEIINPQTTENQLTP